MRTIEVQVPTVGWENVGGIEGNGAVAFYDEQLELRLALCSVPKDKFRLMAPAGVTRFEVFEGEWTWYEDAALVDRATNTEVGPVPSDVTIKLV